MRVGRVHALLVSAALLGPACGGKTHQQVANDVVDPGVGGARHSFSDSGLPDASGGGPDDCAPGSKPTPCFRYPEGDPECVMHPAAPLAFGCLDIRAVPRACVYRIQRCMNCLDWCCPYGTDEAAEFIATDGHGGAPSTPAPPGCKRTPGDDGTCIAQDKPPNAYQCPTLIADASLGDEVLAPLECIGNPYAGYACGGADEEGHVCCP